ncbi:MAG: peptide deformylase, partial [Pseudomonadota bacterium]
DAKDRTGADISATLDGLAAVCVQHEVDHLDGKLFLDYLSALKRQRIRRKLEKAQKQSA